METARNDPLVARIEALERERRLVARAGVALGCLVLALVIMGTDLVRRPGTVEAQQFVLKGPDGRVRARLGFNPDGAPALTLLDDRGRDQVRLQGTIDRTGTLYLLDRGDVRVALAAPSDGSATLQFYDRGRNGGSGLYLRPDGTSGLRLGGRAGAHLAARPDGRAELTIIDPDGSERPLAAPATGRQDGADRRVARGGDRDGSPASALEVRTIEPL